MRRQIILVVESKKNPVWQFYKTDTGIFYVKHNFTVRFLFFLKKRIVSCFPEI